MNLNVNEIENQHFKIICSFIFAALATVLIGILLSFVPNKLDTSYILKNFVVDINDFVPELSEKLQYLVCTISFPILYLTFHFWFGKIHFELRDAKSNRVVSTALLFLLLLLAALVNLIDPYYLNIFQINGQPSLGIVLIIFTGCFALLCIKKYETLNSKKRMRLISYFFCIIVIFYIAWLFLTKTYYFDNSYVSYHFDAYFYSIYKVYSGQTPMIDFQNLYGFYPYFFVPLLHLMGGATMMRFSLIICVMVAICFLSFLFILQKLCKNKIIATLGFLAIVCWNVIYFAQAAGGCYLQYLPHRVIFPAIFLSLCSVQVTKLKKWIGIIIYAVISLSLLWNIDTGVIIAITYPAFLIYRELIEHSLKEKCLYKKSAIILAKTLLSVIGVYLFLLIVTFLRTGKIFSLADCFFGQNVFYKYGFYMLRMPAAHPWILLIIVYAIALVKAMNGMRFLGHSHQDQNVTYNSIYFVLSALGLGLFSYYQGRSHDLVFICVCWPAILIITLFAQEYWDKIINATKNAATIFWQTKLKFAAIIILLATFTGVFFVNVLDITKMTTLKDKHFTVKNSEIKNALNVVSEVRKNNEPINLIMYNAAAVYSTINVKWTEHVPATIDLFTKGDCQQILQSIAKANSKVVFDQSTFDMLLSVDKAELLKELSDLYQCELSSYGYYVFVPKSFNELSGNGISSNLMFEYSTGFYEDEGNSHWSQRNSRLIIYNFENKEISVNINAQAYSAQSANTVMNISMDKQRYSSISSGGLVNMQFMFDLQPGENIIIFNTNARKKVSAAGDTRSLFFKLQNLTVTTSDKN